LILTLFVILVIVYCCLYKFIIINTDPLENNILLFVQGGKSETPLLQHFLEVRWEYEEYEGITGEYGGYEKSTGVRGEYKGVREVQESRFFPLFFFTWYYNKMYLSRRQEKTSNIV